MLVRIMWYSIGLLAATTVLADGRRTIEVTPFAAFSTGGEFEQSATANAFDLDDVSSGGIAVNFHANSYGDYELLYSKQNNKLSEGALFAGSPGVDLDIEYFQFGGNYLFSGQRLQPYIVATIGASRFRPGRSGLQSETFFAFSGGAGVKFHLSDNLGLRFEGRAFASLVDDATDIFCVTGIGDNICAVATDGDLVTQWTASAGLSIRF